MIEFIGDGKIEGTIKIGISKITNVNWINNVITSGQLNIGHENGVHTKVNFRDGQVDESIVFFPDGITYNNYEFDGTNFRGKGKHIFANGTYTGNFLNNKSHGQGTFEYLNGKVFNGIFEDGRRLNGKVTFQNNNYFEGEFKDDKPFKGTYKCFKNNDYYEGEFDGEILFKGTIKYTYSDGSV